MSQITLKGETANSLFKKFKDYKTIEVVESLIDDNTFGAIIGASKTRKSFLAMELGLSLISGKPFMGHYKINQTGIKERLLYVNLEFKEEEFSKRLEFMCKSMDIKQSVMKNWISIKHITGGQEIIDTRTLKMNHDVCSGIEAYVMKERITTIIIDPWYMLGAFDENSNTEVAPIVRWLQDLRRKSKIKIILVAHTGKSLNKSAWNDIWSITRGASVLGNNFEWIMAINPNENNKSMASIHHGSRHLRNAPAEPISVKWNEALALWEHTQATNIYQSFYEMMGDEWKLPVKEFKERAEELGLCKAYKITKEFMEQSKNFKWIKGYGKDRTAYIERISTDG